MSTTTHADPPEQWRFLSPPVLGWVLYDFANTIFSFVVVTRYFNDWIITERNQPDVFVGLMTAGISIALVFTLPLLGAIADRRGRHMPILIAFTLLSVTMTALLGVVESVLLALIVAGIATFAFNTADSQYHPLLSVVVPEERKRGRVSGTGVAIGYVGSLVALFVLGAIVEEDHSQQAFVPAAIMFIVFALPCFLLVRERGKPKPATKTPARPLAALVTSLRRARSQPYGRLLLARFFYIDAIATIIAFMTVYAERTGDFTDAQIDLLLAFSTIFAIAGSIVAGLIAERKGPRIVVVVTLIATIATMLTAAVTGSSSLLWGLGPIIGIALGALSTVDRIFLLRLVPAERRGEEFSLYALVGKLSSGFGPLVLWGGTILLFTEAFGFGKFDASRVAVIVLAGAALLGLLILRPLSDEPVDPRGRGDRVGGPAPVGEL